MTGRALLSVDEVERRTTLSASTIRRREKAGDFPKRIRLSATRVAWYEDEVAAWIEAADTRGEAA